MMLKPAIISARLSSQGQRQAAIAQFQEALRLDPEFATAHVNLGAAVESEGHVDEAIEHYQWVLRLKPGDALAQLNLGAAARAPRSTERGARTLCRGNPLQSSAGQAHYSYGSALASAASGTRGFGSSSRPCKSIRSTRRPITILAWRSKSTATFKRPRPASAAP